MSSRVHPWLSSPVARHCRRAGLVLAGTLGLLVGSGAAAGADAETAVGTAHVAQTTAAEVPFGFLGPVGIATAVVGVVGMLIGVTRAAVRRRSHTADPAGQPADEAPLAARGSLPIEHVPSRAWASTYVEPDEELTQPLVRVDGPTAA